MKNDKERKAYVENPANWRLISSLNDKIRIVHLTYHDKAWYRIQIMKEQNYYDHAAGDFKKRIEWVTLETCLFDPERGVFGEHWSATNIVDSIKTIDRESKS
jgi:hypothetical protein